MLKRLFISILCLSAVVCAQAQDDLVIVNREITAGMGVLPIIKTGGTFMGPVYNIDFCKLLNDYLTVGASFCISGNRIWQWLGTGTSRFMALMAQLRYNYISERYFRTYFMFDLGLSYGKYYRDQGSMKYDIGGAWYAGFGVELGDLTAFFTEVGVGSKGLISLGLRFRF